VIPTLPRPAWLRAATAFYVGAFLMFLFVPLVIVAVFAFNDAPYPAPPWYGFTLDWFLGNEAAGRIGLFRDQELLGSIWTSSVVALWVTGLSVAVGTANAFLMEREQFPGKGHPFDAHAHATRHSGVILGISILAFASRVADLWSELFGSRRFSAARLAAGGPGPVLLHCRDCNAHHQRAAEALRPYSGGRGPQSGGIRAAVLWTITLPYLRPALIGSAAIAFLMSFENFNTTLMLVGTDSPLTIMMYGRMREGATPCSMRSACS